MEKRLYKVALSGLIVLCLWLPTGAAQTILTNELGRRIVVFPDSTWKYVEDSTFYALELQSELKEKERLSQLKKAEAEVRQLALELISTRLRKVERSALLESFLEKKDSTPLEVLLEAEARWSVLDKQERELEKAYRQANENFAFLQQQQPVPVLPQQTVSSPLLKDKEIKPVISETESLEPSNPDIPSSPPIENEQIKPVITETKSLEPSNPDIPSSPVLRRYLDDEPYLDVMKYPPSTPCKYASAADSQTGKTTQRALEPELFFSKTDKALQRYFTKGDLIRCFANLVSAGAGLRYLQLNIIIASENCPQIFGQIENRALVTFQTLDGQPIYFFNNQPGPGIWQPELSAYVYRLQMQVGGKEEKLLRTKEIESITVRWNKVQETFQVYDLDFFIRQFRCLDSL